MSLEEYGLILLTRMSMMILLTSVSVLILLSIGTVTILLAGIFVGVLTFIWSILVVECISKAPVENRFNN